MNEIKHYPSNTDYGCDRQGNVYSRKNNKYGYLPDGEWKQMTQTPAIKGRYYSVRIAGVTTLVHRIIAETFIDNVDNKPQVNHINNIGTDNRIENLEWVTGSENIQHRYDLGGHGNHKVTDKVRSGIISKNKMGWKNADIANYYNLSKLTVQSITKELKNKYILKGSESGQSKLKEHQVVWILNQYDRGRDLFGKKITYARLAKIFGVSYQSITNIVLRKTWRHI